MFQLPGGGWQGPPINGQPFPTSGFALPPAPVTAANLRRPAAAGAAPQSSPSTQLPTGPSSFSPFGDSSMVPQVQTSITPTGVYTPQQTQWAKNQALAGISAQNNLRELLHGSDTPGVSRSAGSIQAVLPQLAQARGEAAYAQQAIPFGDATANATQMLQGQNAQGQEWLGLAGASNTMNQQALANQYNQYTSLLNLLGGLGLFG